MFNLYINLYIYLYLYINLYLYIYLYLNLYVTSTFTSISTSSYASTSISTSTNLPLNHKINFSKLKYCYHIILPKHFYYLFIYIPCKINVYIYPTQKAYQIIIYISNSSPDNLMDQLMSELNVCIFQKLLYPWIEST